MLIFGKYGCGCGCTRPSVTVTHLVRSKPLFSTNVTNPPINPSPKQFTSKPDTTCLSGCAMETAAMDKCAAMAHEISKKCGCVPHPNQGSLCV